MNVLILIAVLAVCSCPVNSNYSDDTDDDPEYDSENDSVNGYETDTEKPDTTCTTPGGDKGECMLLKECQPLIELVTRKNKTYEDVDLVKKSQCRQFGSLTGKICCPISALAPQLLTQELTCFTPENKTGKCMSIKSCPHVKNLLRPPVNQENFDFVTKSRCEGPEKYSVCCGPPPDSEVVEYDNCPAQMSAFPPNPRTYCCGADNRVGNKIASGNVTSIDDYPWLVMIEYIKKNTKYLNCGGTLISGKYVLTAGHCLVGPQLQGTTPVSVRLGEFDIAHEGPDCTDVDGQGGMDCTDGVTRIDIEQIIPYPDYNPVGQKRHDIGLLRLKETAPFTDFIRPICLPSKDWTKSRNTPANFTLFTAGWGAVSDTEKYSKLKVHVAIPYVERSKCQQAYMNRPNINITLWKGQVCAGGDGKEACKGDSGGPLMYNNKLHFEIFGIVSFGQTPCGRLDTPGVYTNVYQYLKWIKSTIVR